jgi:Flp pilus assembly protein TadD
MVKALLSVAVLASVLIGCEPPPARDQLLETAKNEIQAGQTDQAKVTLDRVRYYYPGDPEALYGLGRIAHKEGNLPQAMFFYRACLDSAPWHDRARLWLERAVVEAATEPEPFGYNY